ncbi:MAG TPA: ammonia channel protein [Deltaproteobacteria bacterium]|nr:ammonia channel protein [Deltaproteobacteria bacterium]
MRSTVRWRRAATLSLALISLILGSSVAFSNSIHGEPPSFQTAQVEVIPPADEIVVKAEPNLEQRIADLEAYINNTARYADVADSKVLSKVEGAGPGHNAWMMISAALVLFMTLPGLALFYGGLVRKKNVLSVLAQCLGITGLVTLLWWAVGYSLVFSSGGPILGDLSFAFLKGVGAAPNTNYSYWVSQSVFSMYQMMFAIITPALIVGAIAERMKFSAILLFVAIWMFVIYFPLAHMIWGTDGLMNGVWNANATIKAIDFAGGTVVHMSSGWSALLLCMILGKRIGFGKEHMPPHSMVLCMVGTGILWVGWYGFNAGSAVAADGIAANAFMTTTVAAAVACFSWALAEWATRGKPSVLGFCSGAVAGLVVITPGAGFVSVSSAVIIGVFAGLVPFFAVTKMKHWLGYDDALDTFGVHAVGGTMGALLTGFFASADVNANLSTNLKDILAKGTLWVEQLKAMGLTIAMSIVGTVVIAYLLKAVIGLRAAREVEIQGLDLAEHGEEGYIY